MYIKEPAPLTSPFYAWFDSEEQKSYEICFRVKVSSLCIDKLNQILIMRQTTKSVPGGK